MKIVGVVVAVILSLLVLGYTVLFLLVRARVARESPVIEVTTLIRGPTDNANSMDDHLTIENGAEYGWHCLLKTTSTDLSWQESLTIPSKPVSWAHPNLIRVSADGRTASSSGEGVIVPSRTFGEMLERLCFVRTVYRYNAWSVVAGDPAGDYVFAVTIDGNTVTRTVRLTTD